MTSETRINEITRSHARLTADANDQVHDILSALVMKIDHALHSTRGALADNQGIEDFRVCDLQELAERLTDEVATINKLKTQDELIRRTAEIINF